MHSLTVDDEFVALSKVVSVLETLGPCDAFTSGQQALEQFRRTLAKGGHYDLILIDINLSDTNGLELLGRFQKEERACGAKPAKKLIVSANSTVFNVEAAIAGNCDGFLVKPVRRAVLLEKLAALQLAPPAADLTDPIANA